MEVKVGGFRAALPKPVWGTPHDVAGKLVTALASSFATNMLESSWHRPLKILETGYGVMLSGVRFVLWSSCSILNNVLCSVGIGHGTVRSSPVQQPELYVHPFSNPDPWSVWEDHLLSASLKLVIPRQREVCYFDRFCSECGEVIFVMVASSKLLVGTSNNKLEGFSVSVCITLEELTCVSSSTSSHLEQSREGRSCGVTPLLSTVVTHMVLDSEANDHVGFYAPQDAKWSGDDACWVTAVFTCTSSVFQLVMPSQRCESLLKFQAVTMKMIFLKVRQEKRLKKSHMLPSSTEP